MQTKTSRSDTWICNEISHTTTRQPAIYYAIQPKPKVQSISGGLGTGENVTLQLYTASPFETDDDLTLTNICAAVNGSQTAVKAWDGGGWDAADGTGSGNRNLTVRQVRLQDTSTVDISGCSYAAGTGTVESDLVFAEIGITSGGYFPGQPITSPITIDTNDLPAGSAGQTYSETLTASGGEAPYDWALVSGTLCSGLSLTAGGVISGVTDSAEVCSFTVRAEDQAGSTATRPLEITVTGADQLGTRLIGDPNATSALAAYTAPEAVVCNATVGPVGTVTDVEAVRSRAVVMQGLAPGTTTTLRIDCGGAGASALVFDTLPEAPFVNRSIPILARVPATLAGHVDRLVVEYGVAPGALTQSVSVPCAAGTCMPGVSGLSDSVLWLRRIWMLGAGQCGRSKAEPVLIRP